MKTFTNGLSIILPTGIMLYILLLVLEKSEEIFKGVIVFFIPEKYYFLGMGIIIGLLFIYLVGLLLKVWIFQKLKELIDKMINKMPIFNSIYGGLQDFFNFTSNIKKKDEKIVVMVELPSIESKIIGFITLKEFEKFDNIDLDEHLLVYLQMSYQIGGYSLFIPKKNITPIDMNIEEALRFVATAGISKSKENNK